MAAAFETLRLASGSLGRDAAEAVACLSRELAQAFALGAKHQGEGRVSAVVSSGSAPSSASPTRRNPASPS